jgi:hypothetical protein
MQFLQAGQLLVVGYCPGCQRAESMTTPFVPAFVSELEDLPEGKQMCYLFTTPGGKKHVRHLIAFVRKELDVLTAPLHFASVPHFLLDSGLRKLALSKGAVPANRLIFLKVMAAWQYL